MLRVATVVLAIAVLASAAASIATPSTVAAPSLTTRLARALAAADISPSQTAAVAVDLETSQVVYGTNPFRALLPASAEKLPVSFAALRVLGPSYRFRTSVVASGTASGTTWRGDLFLVGHGDPTLGPPDLDRLARQVVAAGILRVTGQVRGDETHFDTRRDAPGWKRGYLGIESRPLSALSVATVELRHANASAVAAAKAFTRALENRGVAFGVWREPFTELRVPLLFNLRRDPFERAQHNANVYNDWFLDRAFVIVPLQGMAARFLQSMKDYPPSQSPGSFNLSKIEAQLRAGVGSN